MTKLIYTFVLILLGYYSNAQTNRFFYELRLKIDSTSSNYITTNMVLDVNLKDVKFYEAEFLVADSINMNLKKNTPMKQYSSQTGQLLKRSKGTFENINYFSILFDYYQYTTIDPIEWKISNETKNYQNYLLQKATTTFGGRNWIAWFNADIPINEGPYKFYGLPGLIFLISDDKENFSYSLIKSQTIPKTFVTKNFIESFYGKKPIKIDEKRRKQLLLNYYNDPFSYQRNNFDKEKKDWTIIINGKDIKSLEELHEQSKIMQNMIKKFNNPIELNKAISY